MIETVRDTVELQNAQPHDFKICAVSGIDIDCKDINHSIVPEVIEESLVNSEILFDSEGEEFRVTRKSLKANTEIEIVEDPKRGSVKKGEIWRDRQHRKMIAGLRRLIEYKFVGTVIPLEGLLQLEEIQDFTDRVEDLREAVSKSNKLSLNELGEVVANKQECGTAQPAGLLALPYKRFIYKFDGTDFFVNHKPVYLSESLVDRDTTQAVDGDTGNTVWDAAVLLTSYLDSNVSLVRDKHVLELGSGLGLCGIASSHIGARIVSFTDLGYILESTRANLASNGIDLDVNRVVELDWSHPDCATLDWSSVQVVIASDIVWLDKLIDPLLTTLNFMRDHCPNLERIILCNQRRSDIVTDTFLSRTQNFFHIENTQTDGSLEIHTLTRRHIV